MKGGGFRIVMAEVSYGSIGQDKLQYTMGEVDMSARLQARMQQLKDSTHQRSQSVCLSLRLGAYKCQLS